MQTEERPLPHYSSHVVSLFPKPPHYASADCQPFWPAQVSITCYISFFTLLWHAKSPNKRRCLWPTLCTVGFWNATLTSCTPSFQEQISTVEERPVLLRDSLRHSTCDGLWDRKSQTEGVVGEGAICSWGILKRGSWRRLNICKSPLLPQNSYCPQNSGMVQDSYNRPKLRVIFNL
jgi:hypothetical protein